MVWPLASVPLKLDCAVCATRSELHQRELSVIVPIEGITRLRVDEVFTTR